MNENNKTSKKDDRSASLPIGMCIGLAVGTAIGAGTHHIGMWLQLDSLQDCVLALCWAAKIGMNTKTI